MTITSSTTPIVPISTPASQIIVHQDNFALPTRFILDDTNYLLWSQLMKMRIVAHNKAGYLTEEAARPELGDLKLEEWITEYHQVKSWVIDSMKSSLMQRFIRLPTAKEIWEFVSKTFYNRTDETSIFELNQKSFTTK